MVSGFVVDNKLSLGELKTLFFKALRGVLCHVRVMCTEFQPYADELFLISE